jgi:dehydrogenase/reductase SDR family member 12
MAYFETSLLVPRPVETTFGFVSDFRNAVHWDPRTYAAQQATPGPIGLGTRFVLTGGLLPEAILIRLRIRPSLMGMRLPYDVVEFTPPVAFVLAGETRTLRYRDRLEFSTDGDGTRLRYVAELSLKGMLAVGEPVLRIMFARIGRDATRSLSDTIVQRTGGAARA